jgi:hypothetical protein
MTGAATTFLISSGRGVSGGLEGVTTLPAELAAISKAITGAYLSSEGNAFSTRTAGQIIQENFNPGEFGSPGGPLFGVQFSQLPCSDLSARAGDGLIGPKRSPLGLSADPGGFPLYKNGAVVGGIGVIADGVYGFDPNVLDRDDDLDELIALAGTVGFEAPIAIRADRIFADGTSLRYTDVAYASVGLVGGASFASTAGALIPVAGYYNGAGLFGGTTYGSEASGVRASTSAEFSIRDAFVLSNGAGTARFPVRCSRPATATANTAPPTAPAPRRWSSN